MILRIDRWQTELPPPSDPDPNGATVVQELMGGRFGEMSTLMNYTFQSFNFRNRQGARPFYDLIANIAAEEYGHIELVAAAINTMLTGADTAGARPRNSQQFIAGGKSCLPQDSMGKPWSGDYVTATGDLVEDLTHNFFLETGARNNKLKVYEMVDHPAARALTGYLLVRGGVHQVAYARAVEKLTGADLSKMFPAPRIPTDKIPECRPHLERGDHLRLYRFSPNDYREIVAVFNGPHPETGEDLVVVDEAPEGVPPLDLPPETDRLRPGLRARGDRRDRPQAARGVRAAEGADGRRRRQRRGRRREGEGQGHLTGASDSYSGRPGGVRAPRPSAGNKSAMSPTSCGRGGPLWPLAGDKEAIRFGERALTYARARRAPPPRSSRRSPAPRASPSSPRRRSRPASPRSARSTPASRSCPINPKAGERELAHILADSAPGARAHRARRRAPGRARAACAASTSTSTALAATRAAPPTSPDPRRPRSSSTPRARPARRRASCCRAARSPPTSTRSPRRGSGPATTCWRTGCRCSTSTG